MIGIDRVPGEHVTNVIDLSSAAEATPLLLTALDGAEVVVHAAAHPGPSLEPPAGVDPAWGGAAVRSGIIGLEARLNTPMTDSAVLTSCGGVDILVGSCSDLLFLSF